LAEELFIGPNRVVVVAGGDQTAGRFAMVEWHMAPPPAPGPPEHRHHREDEAVPVLDGELDVLVDETTRHLTAGGFMFVPRMTWHTVANVGTRVCRFLVVLSPPGFEGFWRETARRLAGRPPPTPADLLALQDRFGMETRDRVGRTFD
jgi:quercetin dioxygenase-like cupin family protein